MKSGIFAAAAIAAFSLSQPAFAERTKIGELRCEVSGGLGLIITSSKELECRFRSARGGTEGYHGQINKFGLDLGGTDRGVLVWDVFGVTEGPLHHSLAGEYAGVGASATVGVGLGANAMVGGSNREFSLQPLSVQTQTGLNIAAGVSSITLRPGE